MLWPHRELKQPAMTLGVPHLEYLELVALEQPVELAITDRVRAASFEVAG